MKNMLFLLIFFFSYTGFSQCNEKLLSGTFENIKYILKCPTYSYNQESKNFSYIKHPFEKGNIEMVKHDYIKIDSIVKNIILKEASAYFKEKLIFQSFEKVYKDSLDNFKNNALKRDLDKCKVKYSIYYYFEPIENVKYCIGYAFDESLNWIKEDKVSYLVPYDDEYGKIIEYPIYENVKPFENISICSLKELGKHYLNNDVENLELIFLKESFYWKMNELKLQYRGENIVKSVLINPNDLQDYLIKDANTYVEF
ncbi:hypothetical protein [Paenimyroides baculatum]|uniref:Uncharacterized protein n=1 Tax=Paenimyroides baculatum TaxID=2608000 RepID=A0A5M6CGA2_9FLAO|nr:hypothetical protein [Paenimyroides baculatum]KAA5534057.1 hypothetical protein F0460_10285 [Paenimyroides baculatum]